MLTNTHYGTVNVKCKAKETWMNVTNSFGLTTCEKCISILSEEAKMTNKIALLHYYQEERFSNSNDIRDRVPTLLKTQCHSRQSLNNKWVHSHGNDFDNPPVCDKRFDKYQEVATITNKIY